MVQKQLKILRKRKQKLKIFARATTGLFHNSSECSKKCNQTIGGLEVNFAINYQSKVQ